MAIVRNVDDDDDDDNDKMPLVMVIIVIARLVHVNTGLHASSLCAPLREVMVLGCILGAVIEIRGLGGCRLSLSPCHSGKQCVLEVYIWFLNVQ